MLTFVAVLHILISIMLIGMVLMQDSKGGGAAGVLGGGGSSSLLGATGATSLLEKVTRWLAISFAFTCILLTVLTVKNSGSVIDSYVPAAAAPGQVPLDVPPEKSAEPTAEAPGALKTDGQVPQQPATPPKK